MQQFRMEERAHLEDVKHRVQLLTPSENIIRCLAFVYQNLMKNGDLKRFENWYLFEYWRKRLIILVGRRRIELPTNGLKVRCSTI